MLPLGCFNRSSVNAWYLLTAKDVNNFMRWTMLTCVTLSCILSRSWWVWHSMMRSVPSLIRSISTEHVNRLWGGTHTHDVKARSNRLFIMCRLKCWVTGLMSGNRCSIITLLMFALANVSAEREQDMDDFGLWHMNYLFNYRSPEHQCNLP